MGRELKRVPMDFDLPIGEVWPGYLTEGDDDPAEPPEGEGFQMWETCSEGSPISPVFATAEELARWLADTGASASGDMTATYDQWLATIKVGWAPTMVMGGGRMMSGVEFIAESRAQPNPLDLPAGPEMNRAVMLALGWTVDERGVWYPPGNKPHKSRWSPLKYSTDPRLQDKLLAALYKAHPEGIVITYVEPGWVNVYPNSGNSRPWVRATTISVALCRLLLVVKRAP